VSANSSHLIGLISDTHGMVRPGVHQALAGVELILHAGDVGGDEVLHELEIIAPVLAVFGNTDGTGNRLLAPAIDRVIGGLSVHVSHGHEVGSPTPARLLERYAADVIVYGHTHQQLIARVDGRLVVNPGAAGARRFKLSPSVALLRIVDGQADVELIALD
jgi:putative phosphoesterase